VRVILGTFSFAAPGGTETYVFTVARELQRLGHEAIVTAEEFGPMAEYAERNGIDVVRTETDLPPDCDAILAHDAIMTAALAQRYPSSRLIYCAHSPIHDVQLPPLVEGVVAAVVVPSELIAVRIRALALEVPIVRLRQPIDTERFRASPIRERPRKAVLLSGYLRGPRRDALVRAWGEAGVECFPVGEGQSELDVVPAIAQADIVVGKSRAALEGMSCGRAVYVYDEFGGDGWVTPENYAALEADSFAGLTTPTPVRPSPSDIADYRQEMGWINRELIVTHHSARRHTNELVEVLRGDGPRREAVTALGEIARLARANWASERRALLAERYAGECQARAVGAESAAEQAGAHAAKLAAQLHAAESLLGTRRVRAGLALGRAIDRVRGRR
jgi:hypothetical protein